MMKLEIQIDDREHEKTLSKYLEFCKNVRSLKKRTLNEYFYIIRLMGDMFDVLKAKTHSEVDSAILSAKESGTVKWSQGYTYKVSVVLRQFYQWALTENLIPFNPYPFTRFKKPSLKEPDFLTEDQFRLIVSNPLLTHQDQTILRVAWDTGARKGELLSLNQVDVDFNNQVIHIMKERSKGEYHGRYCPFTDETKVYIQRQIEWVRANSDTEALFVDSEFNRLGDTSLGRRVAEIGNMRTPKREALRLHLHALRHSLGGRLIDNGAPESFVQRLLGHSTAHMTQHYIHYTKKQFAELYKQHTTLKKDQVLKAYDRFSKSA